MFLFMFLVILGIVLLIASKKIHLPTSEYGGDATRNTKPNTILKLLGYVMFFFALISIIYSSFVVVNPGQVGVKVLFGSTDKDVIHSGLNFINPLYSVHIINAQTQEYTMSSVTSEGKKVGDDALQVQSSDNLQIKMEVTIWWKIDPTRIVEVYNTTGTDYEEKIVRPAIRSIIRDMSIQFPAMELCSGKRDEFVLKVNEKLEVLLNSRGILLEKFLLRDAELPASVKVAVEKKIEAEQQSQQMVYVLQKEKQEADRKRIEAQGIADFQKIVQAGLTKDLLTWKGMEVSKELIHSQNSKLIFFGYQGNPFVLNGGL